MNVLGVYHTAQLAAKQMISNGTKKGSIILVASIASYMAIRRFVDSCQRDDKRLKVPKSDNKNSQKSSAYCGTKGAVRAMCPAIAAELNQYVRNHQSTNTRIIF